MSSVSSPPYPIREHLVFTEKIEAILQMVVELSEQPCIHCAEGKPFEQNPVDHSYHCMWHRLLQWFSVSPMTSQI